MLVEQEAVRDVPPAQHAARKEEGGTER